SPRAPSGRRVVRGARRGGYAYRLCGGRHSRQHYACHYGLHHRRGGDASLFSRALGCSGADRLGLDPHHSPVGTPRSGDVAPPPSRMMEMVSRALRAGVLVVVTVGLATGVSAAGIADLMAPLLAAREREAFGSVDGRAYAEAQRGGGQPTPFPAVSILLMPRSKEFDSELDGIKASYRDSIDTVLEAEPKLRAARVAFERALIEADGGHPLFGGASTATGEFPLSPGPHGAWALPRPRA